MSVLQCSKSLRPLYLFYHMYLISIILKNVQLRMLELFIQNKNDFVSTHAILQQLYLDVIYDVATQQYRYNSVPTSTVVRKAERKVVLYGDGCAALLMEAACFIASPSHAAASETIIRSFNKKSGIRTILRQKNCNVSCRKSQSSCNKEKNVDRVVLFAKTITVLRSYGNFSSLFA